MARIVDNTVLNRWNHRIPFEERGTDLRPAQCIALVTWTINYLDIIADGDHQPSYIEFNFTNHQDARLEELKAAVPELQYLTKSLQGFRQIMKLLSKNPIGITRGNITTLEALIAAKPGMSVVLPKYIRPGTPNADDATDWTRFLVWARRIREHLTYVWDKTRLAVSLIDSFENLGKITLPLPGLATDMLLGIKQKTEVFDSVRAAAVQKNLVMTNTTEYFSLQPPLFENHGLTNSSILDSALPGFIISDELSMDQLQRLYAANTLTFNHCNTPPDPQTWHSLQGYSRTIDSATDKIQRFTPDPIQVARERAGHIKVDVSIVNEKMIRIDEQDDAFTLHYFRHLLVQLEHCVKTIRELQNQGVSWTEDNFGVNAKTLDSWMLQVETKLDERKAAEETTKILKKQTLEHHAKMVKPRNLPKIRTNLDWLNLIREWSHLSKEYPLPEQKFSVIKSCIANEEDMRNTAQMLSYDLIWSYLQTKYGRASTLVPLALGQVQALKTPKTPSQEEANIMAILNFHDLAVEFNSLHRLEFQIIQDIVNTSLSLDYSKRYWSQFVTFRENIKVTAIDSDRIQADISDSDWLATFSGPDFSPDRILHFTAYLKRISEEIRMANPPDKKQHNQASARCSEHSTHLIDQKEKYKCPICQGKHTTKQGKVAKYLNLCPEFITLNPQARGDRCRRLKICLVCLCPKDDNKHQIDKEGFCSATFRYKCTKCSGAAAKKHCTLLHWEQPNASSNRINPQDPPKSPKSGKKKKGGRGKKHDGGSPSTSSNSDQCGGSCENSGHSDNTKKKVTFTVPDNPDTIVVDAVETLTDSDPQVVQVEVHKENSTGLSMLPCAINLSALSNMDELDFLQKKVYIQSCLITHARLQGQIVKFQSLSDYGSTLNFVLDSVMETLKVDRLGHWSGNLRTLNRTTPCRMPFYSLPMMDKNGTIEDMLVLGTESIGFRNQIPLPILNKICCDLKIPSDKVDITWGEITLLIGLENASLLSYPISKYDGIQIRKSEAYKNLLVCQNILSDKLLLAGSCFGDGKTGSIVLKNTGFQQTFNIGEIDDGTYYFENMPSNSMLTAVINQKFVFKIGCILPPRRNSSEVGLNCDSALGITDANAGDNLNCASDITNNPKLTCEPNHQPDSAPISSNDMVSNMKPSPLHPPSPQNCIFSSKRKYAWRSKQKAYSAHHAHLILAVMSVMQAMAPSLPSSEVLFGGNKIRFPTPKEFFPPQDSSPPIQRDKGIFPNFCSSPGHFHILTPKAMEGKNRPIPKAFKPLSSAFPLWSNLRHLIEDGDKGIPTALSIDPGSIKSPVHLKQKNKLRIQQVQTNFSDMVSEIQGHFPLYLLYNLIVENSQVLQTYSADFAGKTPKDLSIILDQQIGSNLDLLTCPDCKVRISRCTSCKYLNSPVSLEEQRQLAILRNAIYLREVAPGISQVRLNYPLDGPRDELFHPKLSNYNQAKRSSINLVRKLKKAGKLQDFENEMIKSVDRDQIKVLSQKEAQEIMKGPHNFILLNYACKESKEGADHNTRPVSNSSCYHVSGSLNSHCIRGPQLLGNLRKIFQNFLLKPFAVAMDITRAYRSVFTDLETNTLRLMVWFREVISNSDKLEECLMILMMVRMNYGDCPSACLLELVLRDFIADGCDTELGRNLAAHSRFVDDILSSFDDVELLRSAVEDFIKSCLKFSFDIKRVISSQMVYYSASDVLENGDTRDKLFSGSDCEEIIFHHIFQYREDLISPVLNLNVHRKSRGLPTGPPLNATDLSQLQITREVVARIAGQVYSLTGSFLEPVIVTSHIYFSQSCRLSEGWKDVISDPEFNVDYKGFLANMAKSAKLTPWPRCQIPQGYEVIKIEAMTDGSLWASSDVAFLISKNSEGKRYCVNVQAGSKIRHHTVPSNELLSLTDACMFISEYLRCHSEKILKNATRDHPLYVNIGNDSKCSHAALSPHKLHKSVLSRNAANVIHSFGREVTSMYPVQVNFYFVPGEGNIADWNSKIPQDNNPLAYCENNIWRYGKEELKSDSYPEIDQVYLQFQNGSLTFFNQPMVQVQCTSCSGEYCLIQENQVLSPRTPPNSPIAVDSLKSMLCGHKYTEDSARNVYNLRGSLTGPTLASLSTAYSHLCDKDQVLFPILAEVNHISSSLYTLLMTSFSSLLKIVHVLNILLQAGSSSAKLNRLGMKATWRDKIRHTQPTNPINMDVSDYLGFMCLVKASQNQFPPTSKKIQTQLICEIQMAATRYSSHEMEQLFNTTYLPVISTKDETFLARLFYHAHTQNSVKGRIHLGLTLSLTAAKSGTFGFLTTNMKITFKTLISKCSRCQLAKKADAGTSYVYWPKSPRLMLCLNKKSPVWEVISLDLIGPYRCRRFAGARGPNVQIWVLVATDLLTKMSAFAICDAYDTKSVLIALEIFVNRHRAPSMIITDAGSQLVRLNLEPDFFRVCHSKNIRILSVGANHQFLNFSETSIKVAKQMMRTILGSPTDSVFTAALTYAEIIHMLSFIERCLASRPILFTENQLQKVISGTDIIHPYLNEPEVSRKVLDLLDGLEAPELFNKIIKNSEEVREVLRSQLIEYLKSQAVLYRPVEGGGIEPKASDVCIYIGDKVNKKFCQIVEVKTPQFSIIRIMKNRKLIEEPVHHRTLRLIYRPRQEQTISGNLGSVTNLIYCFN